VLTDPPLADITCPTLVVHGGAELLALRHAERAATTIPDAELRVIPDGRHHGLWINDDAAQPQSYVLDWIRQHART
jgi:pimeloyl-ACP methyl ester carboxylesterase